MSPQRRDGGGLKGKIMTGVLNHKAFKRGGILGFFVLRYHGLVVKDCRLMNSQNGYWMSIGKNGGY
jgi:hypothetical protein